MTGGSDTRLAPFQALDGVVFGDATLWLVFRCGRYGTGNGAIRVESEGGEPWDTLTVNLSESESAADASFYVKVDNSAGDGRHKPGPGNVRGGVLYAAMRSGLFGLTDEYVGAGFVDRYARRWTWAVCIAADHPAGDRAMPLKVLCPACMASYRQSVDAARAVHHIDRASALRVHLTATPPTPWPGATPNRAERP